MASALIGVANVLLVQAVTFVVSAACLMAIRTREVPPDPDPDRPRLRA